MSTNTLFARRNTRAISRELQLASADASQQQASQTPLDGQPDGIPAIRLHCVDALDAELTPEQRGERARTVLQSSKRMPAVGFYGGRYGENWYVDMIALTHNAVRRQLFDAFLLSNALGKLVLDLAEADLARVYAWLGTLDTFVHAVFDAEDVFIYPLIDGHVRNARTGDGNPVYLPEILAFRGRREAKTQILELLSAARKTREVATGETPSKVHALRYALDQFGGNILDYFSAMEAFAPRLFKKSIKNGVKEKNKVERKLFEYMLTRTQGPMLAALLMQCIESRSRRKDFLERNIRKEKLRVQFKTHVKNVEATHMQLAPTFDRVASQYERKFDVKAFVEHYDATTDAKQTLEMLGDLDINYDAGEVAAAPNVRLEADEVEDDDADDDAELGRYEGDEADEADDDDEYADNDSVGSGLDDDVIEIRATEEHAREMELRASVAGSSAAAAAEPEPEPEPAGPAEAAS